jgi:hypothetical protein
MISATEITEASNNGQMGQPAALTISNTGESLVEKLACNSALPPATEQVTKCRGWRGLSPKAVDKSVNQLSSITLNPTQQRIFPALPQNKAYNFISLKSTI